jgi:hypothetical protein
MSRSTPRNNYIGIAFSPPALYPPLADHSEHGAVFTTVMPWSDQYYFDYALNGATGPYPGIHLHMLPGMGLVRITDAFLANYDGPWPAALAVRYLKGGVPVDQGTLHLRDTRTAVPARMTVDISPTEIHIPHDPHEDHAAITAYFHDADGYLLPLYLQEWEVYLDDPPKGVSLDQRVVWVNSEAQPGSVNVRIVAKAGFEEVIVLKLLPRM